MTTTTDLAAAVARLDAAIAAGDVIRHEWTHTEDGRARACLLASLVPACGVEETASACPASVLPSWLAACVPWIDDAGTAGAWPETIRTFVELLRDSVDAAPALWARLNLHWRRAAIAEAMAHTDDLAVLGICAEVAAMLDADLAGESIDPAAWADAEHAARAAARADAAVRAAAWASAAEAEASEASASAAASAAAASAWAATAEASVWASDAAWAAVSACARAAKTAAADRITAEFFAAWRSELDA